MSASLYNGYVIFTATLGNSNQSKIFSIMMIFGFANGTDFTTDISPYLMDTGYYSNTNNLYDFLFSTMKVDNNIFGYEKIQKIRLVKICDELLLYKGKGATKENSVILYLLMIYLMRIILYFKIEEYKKKKINYIL